MDKALKHKTSKFNMFSHNVLDSEEILKNCKQDHAKSEIGKKKKTKNFESTCIAQEELIEGVWKALNLSRSQMNNFRNTVPGKKRIQSA